MLEYITLLDAEHKPLVSYRVGHWEGPYPWDMPKDVQQALLSHLGVPADAPVGWWIAPKITTQPGEHIFRQHAEAELQVGVRLSPDHTSYVQADGSKHYKLRWEHTTDYMED